MNNCCNSLKISLHKWLNIGIKRKRVENSEEFDESRHPKITLNNSEGAKEDPGIFVSHAQSDSEFLDTLKILEVVAPLNVIH